MYSVLRWLDMARLWSQNWDSLFTIYGVWYVLEDTEGYSKIDTPYRVQTRIVLESRRNRAIVFTVVRCLSEVNRRARPIHAYNRSWYTSPAPG